MPRCMRCGRVQASAEVRRAGGSSGYFCKNFTACYGQQEKLGLKPSKKTRVPTGDVDAEGRLT